MPETDVPKEDLAALRSLSRDAGGPNAPRRRRRLPRWAFWLVVLAVVVGGGYAFQKATSVPAVATARVQKRSPVADREITTANGYCVARVRASVASKLQGRLTKVLVDEGEVVEEGQMLAEVEHLEQDAAVDEAGAQLDQARGEVPVFEALLAEAQARQVSVRAALDERNAGVDEATAVLAEREAQFKRTTYLFEQEIVGDAELDEAREARDVARARQRLAETTFATAETLVEEAIATAEVVKQRLANAQFDIAAAEAVLRRAEAARENAFIRAPFAGMVLRREAEPGEVVSPANTGASGSKTAVVTLADFSTLEIEVDVYERDIARVAEDNPCRIVLDAYPDAPVGGKVRLLRPTADRTRATVQVYVSFDDVPNTARPEMGARVTFYEVGTDPLVPEEVVVPASAVVTRDGVEGAWVLGGREVRFRAVRLLAVGGEGDDRVVQDGLEPGDIVVLAPTDDLADGQRVAEAEN